MDLGKEMSVNTLFNEAEIQYIRQFLLLADSGGIGAVSDACERKEYALIPFNAILEKLINGVSTHDDKRDNYYKWKQDKHSSICPSCKGEVYLLAAPKNVELPRFYFCSTCGYVEHTEKGIVEEGF